MGKSRARQRTAWTSGVDNRIGLSGSTRDRCTGRRRLRPAVQRQAKHPPPTPGRFRMEQAERRRSCSTRPNSTRANSTSRDASAA